MLGRGSRDGRGDRLFEPPAARFVDRLVGALPGATERVKAAAVVARAIVDGEQAKAELRVMAAKFEIKGLAEALAGAKQAIRDARAAPTAVHAAVTELKAVCADLTAQVNALTSDITFEATQLGNGGGASTSEKPLTTTVASGGSNG